MKVALFAPHWPATGARSFPAECNMSTIVESPLAPGAKAFLVKTFPGTEIVDGYRTSLDVDVSEYFRALDCVEVHECEATQYRCCYPFKLAGKGNLYRHLEKFDWNYKDNQWEYREAPKFFRPGSSVLDVGCGPSRFLKMSDRSNLCWRYSRIDK
jgi:hypothetical protein